MEPDPASYPHEDYHPVNSFNRFPECFGFILWRSPRVNPWVQNTRTPGEPNRSFFPPPPLQCVTSAIIRLTHRIPHPCPPWSVHPLPPFDRPRSCRTLLDPKPKTGERPSNHAMARKSSRRGEFGVEVQIAGILRSPRRAGAEPTSAQYGSMVVAHWKGCGGVEEE